jgi:hypothetical protein
MNTSGRALAVVALTLVTTASAQVPNAPAPRLANARSLTCEFSVMATGTWRDGVAETASKPASLRVAFTSVDTEAGTADARGGSGKSHITVRVIGNYLNLMQIDPYGALYVTTVFNTETKNGRLVAVHSRHEYTPVQLPGLTSRPEQYYGSCGIK